MVTTETAETLESHSSQVQEPKAAPIRSDSDMLQKLVTEAVKKVLANQEVTSTDKFSCQNVVSRVVEGLKPSLNSGTSGKVEIVTASAAEEGTDVSVSINKSIPCVYNPTPIAELKKRHIPIISYMPTRESRVAVKRKCSPEGVKPWLGSEVTDSQAAEAKYKPTTIVNTNTRDTTQSYIPTCKADPVLLNSVEDGNSSEYALKLGEAYYPKSKKRREEYVPKKIKAPLKSIEGLKDSAVYDFTPGFNTVNQVSTNASPSSNFQRNDDSQKFYSDLEPKFSDDEEVVNNSQDDTGHFDCDPSKVNGEGVNDTITGQSEIYNDTNSGYLNNEQSTRTCSTKISGNVEDINNENCDGKDSKNSNILMQEISVAKEPLKSLVCSKEKSLETDASKGVEETVRYKCKRSNKSKDPKSYDNSRKHSRRYKEGHISIEKSHSAYRGTSKDESHRRSESKDLKSKDRDRNKYKEKNEEKDRCKERNRDRSENRRKSKSGRRDSRDSEKHRGARDSCESSKKEEHVKKRHGRSKRSSFSAKSDNDDKTFGQSSIHTDNNEERNSVERLASPSESIQSKLEGNADEETDDRRNSIVGNDIDDAIISGSDSDHDVQEECLKIFQVRVRN